jgi:hypothetical protein
MQTTSSSAKHIHIFPTYHLNCLLIAWQLHAPVLRRPSEPEPERRYDYIKKSAHCIKPLYFIKH